MQQTQRLDGTGQACGCACVFGGEGTEGQAGRQENEQQQRAALVAMLNKWQAAKELDAEEQCRVPTTT